MVVSLISIIFKFLFANFLVTLVISLNSIYYFFTIPTIVHPATGLWIIAGAVAIAVAASVLPALRAARLHPVEALRHD